MNTASQVGKQPKSDTEWHPEGSTKTDADGRYYVWNGGKWEEVKDDYEPISYLSPAMDGQDNGKQQTTILNSSDGQTPLDYNYLKNTMTNITNQNNLQLEERQKKLAKLLSNIKIK